jgi:hypothetical protein
MPREAQAKVGFHQTKGVVPQLDREVVQRHNHIDRVLQVMTASPEPPGLAIAWVVQWRAPHERGGSDVATVCEDTTVGSAQCLDPKTTVVALG